MIGASVRIFVCREPQDLRRSFDGLAFAARQVLGEDPRSGALFCFLDERANRPKCLWWDRNGYCLLYNRRARFCLPARDASGSPSLRIDGSEFARLISGVTKEQRPRCSS